MTSAVPTRPLRLVRSAHSPPDRPADVRRRPLTNDELIARLPGVLCEQTDVAVLSEHVLTVGDLRLNPGGRVVTRGESRITLTGNEFDLLSYLMTYPRQALSSQQILDDVWTRRFGGRTGVVDLYIHYLRKKVDAGRTPMIHTVPGFGYLLVAAADAQG